MIVVVFRRKNSPYRGNFAGICEQICYDFFFSLHLVNVYLSDMVDTVVTASLSICNSVSDPLEPWVDLRLTRYLLNLMLLCGVLGNYYK